jgi:hypothetical protein
MSRIEPEGRGKDDWTMAIIGEKKKEKRRGRLFFLTRIVSISTSPIIQDVISEELARI